MNAPTPEEGTTPHRAPSTDPDPPGFKVPDSDRTATGATHDPGPTERAVRGTVHNLPLPDEPLIGIRTLAAWLAVSESVVRHWTAKGPESGLLPRFIRINGQIRFRPSDVRTFLIEREVR